METIKFIKESNEKDLSTLRSSLYKKGILSSFNKDGRIVMYTSKNQRFNKLDDISIECNGLIFDINAMKPLVIPTLNSISNISNINIINNNINNDLYDVYRINDGTVINLYWWEPTNSWVISTTRGYDLTDEKWADLTYIEIIKDILNKTDNSIDDLYKLLDKTHCYTFGFKHPSMHPFYEGLNKPIYTIWFIQSINLNTFKISTQFAKWKEENSTLKDMGGETLNEKDYAPEDCPDDAITVPVFRISNGGAKLEKTHFFSQAEAPKYANGQAL